MPAALAPLAWLGLPDDALPTLPIQDWLRAARGLALETDRTVRVHALILRLVAGYRAQALAASVLPDFASRALLDLLHARGASDVRATVEEMHGALLKLAQLLSTRTDLLPEPYARALAPLQDRVAPRPFGEVEKTLRRELGDGLAAFTWIDDEPLAAASIAQVHRARLASGEEIVLKVQHRTARRLLRADLAAFTRGAWIMDQAFPPSRQAPLAEELATHIAREVDFVAEAASAARMRDGFADDAVPGVRVPAILPELSTQRVLAMEYVAGERLTDVLARLRADGDQAAIERLVTLVVQAYAHQILRCGFFQADPHPGNFLVESDGTLCLIDFGCCKEFPSERRDAFLKLGAALMIRNADAIRTALADAGFRVADVAAEERLAELVARAASGTSGRSESPFEDFVANLGIHPPTDVALLGRVFLALGGLLRTWAPRLNLPVVLAPILLPAVLQTSSRPPAAPAP